MAYENNNKTPATGIVGTVLGGTALAGLTGLLNGNIGGLFGNNNPASSAIYQLSQKDNEIAELKAERYADQQMNILQLEISNMKQRLAAMEAAAPLREKIVEEQVGFVSGTVARLVQPMVSGANVFPAPSSSTVAQAA